MDSCAEAARARDEFDQLQISFSPSGFLVFNSNFARTNQDGPQGKAPNVLTSPHGQAGQKINALPLQRHSICSRGQLLRNPVSAEFNNRFGSPIPTSGFRMAMHSIFTPKMSVREKKIPE
jgi:hypothetical protein